MADIPDSVDPAHCTAEHVPAPPMRMTMTREESELKQLAYERERALWRKQVGRIEMK